MFKLFSYMVGVVALLGVYSVEVGEFRAYRGTRQVERMYTLYSEHLTKVTRDNG